MNLYGFTLIRNGLKYDYPFQESLASLCSLCSHVFVALGKSEDGTEKAIKRFPNVTLIPTIWDENLRNNGLILSQQTNIALTELRKTHQNGWGIYLQADEVLDVDDFEQIRKDILQADYENCDAVRFRYLHFWQSYGKIAIAKRWYPQEIRAIRLDSSIESYGDAQSFRKFSKVYDSDVFVYHYGHVREKVAYQKKIEQFHRWWHKDEDIPEIIAKCKVRDSVEELLDYLGPHPELMKKRIGENFEAKIRKQVYLIGNKEYYPKNFSKNIRAEQVHWHQSYFDVPPFERANAVALNGGFLLEWLTGSGVPKSMRSSLARTWSKTFVATLKLSKKGIGLGKIGLYQ